MRGACVLTCMRWYLSKCTINDAHKTTNTTSKPNFYDVCICACASISSSPTQNWLPAYLLHNRPRISIAHPQAEQAKSACVHVCVCVCVCYDDFLFAVNRAQMGDAAVCREFMLGSPKPKQSVIWRHKVKAICGRL